MNRLLTLIMGLILILTPISAQADDLYAPDYPGIGNDYTQNIAHSMATLAVVKYYKIYGHFPDDWKQVVSSGIYDNPLTGFKGESIDPDDGNLDFVSDLSFENNDGRFVVTWMDPSTLAIRRFNVNTEGTYEGYFERVKETQNLTSEQESRLDEYAADENKLKQFAIIGLLKHAIGIYSGLHGNAPTSVDEVLDSGITPINRNTINPVTGKPFKFDGSAGDIEFVYNPEIGASFVHKDGPEYFTVGINY